MDAYPAPSGTFPSRTAEILHGICQWTAPFHEHRVARAALTLLASWSGLGVRHEMDRHGNIFGYWWNAPHDGPGRRGMAMMAHMDHPGFQVVRWSGERRIELEVLGGVPLKLINRDPILVLTPEGPLRGQMDQPIPPTRYDGTAGALLDEDPGRDVTGCPAIFDLPMFYLAGGLVHGLAMDDLAGCAMGLAALEQIAREKLPVDAYVVLHRAEEVGMLGACVSAQECRVPNDTVMICLEASRTLPGAAVHGGSVIRTGDKTFMFHPDPESLLVAAAKNLRQRGAPVQQTRLTGGMCEAALYQAFGYEATAMAVPLLNYHNAGGERVAPEAVSAHDLANGTELLVEAARQLPCFSVKSRMQLRAERRMLLEQSRARLLKPFP